MAFIIKRSFPLTLVLQQSVIWSSRRRDKRRREERQRLIDYRPPSLQLLPPPDLLSKEEPFPIFDNIHDPSGLFPVRLRNSSKRSITVRKGETATCLTDRPKVFALKSHFSHIFATPVAYFATPPWQGSRIF